MAAIALHQKPATNASGSSAGYQPVSQSPPGLERIEKCANETKWTRDNESKLVSAWDFNPNIEDLVEHETVEKIRSFMGLEKPEEPKSFIWQLIRNILSWFGIDITPTDVFLQKLQTELGKGCCHGISLALMGALLEAEKGNSSIKIEDIIANLSKEDIILLQVLSNLRSEIKKLNSLRAEEQQIKICQRQNVRHTPKRKIPSDIQKETEETLRAKIQQGRDLIVEIDAKIIKLSDFQFDEEATASTAVNIRGFLSDDINNNGKFVISCFPKTDKQSAESTEEQIAGHSIFVDLKNFTFYDINVGQYKFSSKKECIQAVQDRVAEYKEYEGGMWKMRVVRPPVPKEQPRIEQPPVQANHLNGGLMSRFVAGASQMAASASNAVKRGSNEDSTSPTDQEPKPKKPGFLSKLNPFKKKQNTVETSGNDSD